MSLQKTKTGLTPAMRLLVMLLPVLLLAGCAGTGGPGAGSTVAKRAMERWDAILAADYDTAYEYYSPGYRSSQTRGDFELAQRLRKVQFSDAEFQSEECTENACTLNFKVFYTIASPVPGIETWRGNQSMDERWIRTDGQWWYFPDN